MKRSPDVVNDKEQPENVAFMLRMSENKIMVISQYFGFFGSNSGTIQIVPYHEFLNKPFVKMVACRQFENQPDNIVPNTLDFVNEIR